MSRSFLVEARARYARANEAALRWMLGRTRRAPWLDTKLDPLALRDYGPADGWRGPDVTYGWIQGRGLEALVRFAAHFAATDGPLAGKLTEVARGLDTALARMVRRDGGAAFAYRGAELEPVRPDAAGRPVAQDMGAGVATFSDIFVRNGLLAARHAFGQDVREAGAALLAIADRIEAGRFQIDEKAELGDAALAVQGEAYGPRMIFLGASALAAGCGAPAVAARAAGIVAHVFARHLRPDGLLADDVGEDRVNPGHAIEFAGFALECRRAGALDHPADALADLVAGHWRAGRRGPGLALYVSGATGAALDPWLPWWSLPETVRAAALAYEATGRDDMLAIWREADALFFAHYWRGSPPIAYQTLTAAGPVDHVPATPDLDPGYHTGLSLLGAQEAAERLLA